MEYDPQKETDTLVAEIRDVNAKAIQIARAVAWLVLAFLGYVFFGLGLFAQMDRESTVPPATAAATQPAATPQSTSAPAPTSLAPVPEREIPRSLAIAGKAFALVGLVFLILIVVAFGYALHQYGVSKMHRVRYWRQIHAIRAQGLKSSGTDFADRSLLPLDDRRPRISANSRWFGVWASVSVFLLAACVLVVLAGAWHLQDIMHSLHAAHQYHRRAQQFEGQMAVNLEAKAASSYKQGARRWWRACGPMTPIAFLLAVVLGKLSLSYYEKLLLAEAISAGNSFPRFPEQYMTQRRRLMRACHVLMFIGAPVLLYLGARIMEPGIIHRGFTMQYLVNYIDDLGFGSEKLVSGAAYWTAIILAAICLMLQVFAVVPVLRLFPHDGPGRLETVRDYFKPDPEADAALTAKRMAKYLQRRGLPLRCAVCSRLLGGPRQTTHEQIADNTGKDPTMAQQPTPEECGRRVLDLYAQQGLRTGEQLVIGSMIGAFNEAPWRSADLESGLQWCIEQGYLEQKRANMYHLTEAGFAAM